LSKENEATVRIVRLSLMLDRDMYRRIRLNFFRLHCQFVSGNDRRTSYDYFMLTCGPISAKSQTLASDGAVSMIADNGALITSSPPSGSELLGECGHSSLIQ
jgi:hypothetical protein